MYDRKVCRFPAVDFLDKLRAFTFGSREDLAAKMAADWNEIWTKDMLDDLCRSPHEPKASTLAKIAWSLGQTKLYPHPTEFVAKED